MPISSEANDLSRRRIIGPNRPESKLSSRRHGNSIQPATWSLNVTAERATFLARHIDYEAQATTLRLMASIVDSRVESAQAFLYSGLTMTFRQALYITRDERRALSLYFHGAQAPKKKRTRAHRHTPRSFSQKYYRWRDARHVCGHARPSAAGVKVTAIINALASRAKSLLARAIVARVRNA